MLNLAEVITERALLDTFRPLAAHAAATNPKALTSAVASTLSPALRSGLASFDDWLGGGIVGGELIEWGLGEGMATRELLLCFLRQQPSNLVLWIYPQHKQVYAPAWAARGIDLKRTFFIACNEPVRTLKPLFQEKLFPLLVIDSPQKIKTAELAYLSQRIRQTGQNIFLLRPFPLQGGRGNAHARRRINVHFNEHDKKFFLQYIRGGRSSKSQTSLYLAQQEISK